MSQLEGYPRVVVVHGLNHDERVAWLKPYALIADRYVQPLPEDIATEFGIDFETLVAKKGLALGLGDTFKTYNPTDPETIEWEDGKLQIVGDYIPEVDTL
jgi:hypothetical protein